MPGTVRITPVIATPLLLVILALLPLVNLRLTTVLSSLILHPPL